MARLPEAIELLARRAGLQPVADSSALPPRSITTSNEDELESWLDWACARVGIEKESVETTGEEFDSFLRSAGPALLRYYVESELSILLLLNATARYVRFIGPDLRIKRYSRHSVYTALWAERERPARAAADVLVQHVNISEQSRASVVRLLVKERMASQRMDGCWILRMPTTRGFWSQLAAFQFSRRVLAMLAVFGTLYLLEIIGWMIIGRGALEGRLDYGWLIAWVLVLLTIVPMRLVGTWLQGTCAIQFGMALKQRLLSGALRMSLDEVRRKGVGQLVGEVMESQSLEALATNSGFSVPLAAIELILAAWVLAWGAGGFGQALSLLLWIAGILFVSWRYYQRLRCWTKERIRLTYGLIEQMVGHRTRVAQESPGERFLAEDQSLERFLHSSREFDNSYVPLAWGGPRGWLIVGLLGLLPAFMWGRIEVMGLAMSLGGILLAYRAFGEIGSGLTALARAAVAWETIAALFNAAKQEDAVDAHSPVWQSLRQSHRNIGETKDVLIQARDVVYRYEPQGAPVLNGCNLTIYHGDRLLLEGSSGGGKSTLAALLVGLRKQDAGLLMLNGLDRATLGQNWRLLSTAASQFHENHVLTGSFAFNLLMGRCWPPTPTDIMDAKQLCEELGLGDLLSRMPSGLMQMVGETGWQLSHGERSRLFLARALLQKAELVVLDESFAALDPETLTQCLRCALLRAPTLVVIAHP